MPAHHHGSFKGPTTSNSSGPTPPSQAYHHHRGHRRGHSYGGPMSSHHTPLESRPSHPNTHHGTLPSHHTGTTTSAAIIKGHRRTLSGCMPMVGLGVVAWSSLRDLEVPATFHQQANLRSKSPEGALSTDLRTSSPEGKRSQSEVDAKCLSPDLLEKDMSLGEMECGLGPCVLPSYFRSFANIKFFVAILSLLVTLQQAIASGYVNAVITTIEARFEIPSKFTGLVASSYEIGNVVTVLFVSYLGAKRHIPRWIAIGVFVMAIGLVVFTLPHFLSTDRVQIQRDTILDSLVTARLVQEEENYNATPGHYVGDLKNYSNPSAFLNPEFEPDILYLPPHNSFCHSKNPPQSSRFIDIDSRKLNALGDSDASERPRMDVDDLSKAQFPPITKEEIRFYGKTHGCGVETLEADGTTTTSEPESYGHPLILFMLAQVLLGCGGSPLFTLGVTYVDDHVAKESSSVYIGIIYATAAFGPVLGFLLAAWLLTIPSSVISAAEEEGSQFIGLWWGGFLIAAVLLFIACMPFLFFPKFLTKSKEKEAEYELAEAAQQASGPEDTNYGQSIRDIPRSIWRLVTNPVYVVTCLGGCMEMNIISGFIVFLPKYLETQFNMGRSKASLFTGGIAIPGACVGIFIGGYLMKRLQLTPSGAARLVVITNIICLFGHSCFFFLGCGNPNLAGAIVPYPGTPEPTDFAPLPVNLTSPCNVDCACDSSLDAQYVCHAGITYFSPCHAGCSVNLTQCSCAGGFDVTPGVCPTDNSCNTLPFFMIVLFFMSATVAMTQMPLLMIILRSVQPEERSFALGMQFVIFRLLGYIPSPIVFGNVIDSACLLWSVRRCSKLLPAVSGRCIRYDIMDFRFKYAGILAGFKLAAMVLFLYDYFQLKQIEEKEEADLVITELEGLKIRSNSTASLDKLFEESADEREREPDVKILPVTTPNQQQPTT